VEDWIVRVVSKRQYPPPSPTVHPPAPFGQWSALLDALARRVQAEVAPEHLEGARACFRILRQLLDLSPYRPVADRRDRSLRGLERAKEEMTP
jgi:hypothetical protein